jgi:hypothetical protein
MSSPVERPYGSPELGSKYQGQSQPTASAFYRDFERANGTADSNGLADSNGSRKRPAAESQAPDRTPAR